MLPKIYDNYPDSTLKKRKNLLITTFIGFVIGYGKIIPHKISFLGIEFEKVQKDLFLTIVIVLISYFLIDFYRTIWIDNQRAKGKISSESKKKVTSHGNKIEYEETITKTKYTEPWQFAFPSIMVHSVIETVFPLIASLISIFFISSNY